MTVTVNELVGGKFVAHQVDVDMAHKTIEEQKQQVDDLLASEDIPSFESGHFIGLE